MEFRIGVNSGDVMVEGEQIYGDGVNVAARLESLADAGGICISGSVHEQIRNKLGLSYKDLGEQRVKNIATPVRVFRIIADATNSGGVRRFRPKHLKVAGVCMATLLIVGAVTLIVQHLSLRQPTTAEWIPHAALDLPDKPSIAVLPFVNLSGDAGQDYFTDGITDSLI